MMRPKNTFFGLADEKPCRLLDMRDCNQPQWIEINRQIAGAELMLQPLWFRPFLGVPSLRRKLGYGHWSRGWEYPWAVVNGELQPGMRLLDVGSGGSAFPVWLGLQGFEVNVADPSLDNNGEANIQDWRKRLLQTIGLTFAWGLNSGAKKRRVPVTYVFDAVQALSYAEGFFDRVFCLSVLEHIPVEQWDVCMAQMARVLCPGGRILVTMDMTTPNADRRQYVNLCTRGDLRLLNEVDYPVPISPEDKQLRHPGYTYEVLGMVWERKE